MQVLHVVVGMRRKVSSWRNQVSSSLCVVVSMLVDATSMIVGKLVAMCYVVCLGTK